MNTAFFDYCIKSLKRRKKHVLKAVMAIFLSFTFVAGVLLFRYNMYEWQIQSAKHRFGDWFVMMNGNDSRENAQLKSHPYLNDSGKVSISNHQYSNNWNQTDIKIGYMDNDFVRLSNITPDKGEFPKNDDEIAVEWNTLLLLNQGTDIGQDITLNIIVNNSKASSGWDRITKTYKLSGILKSYTNVWVGGSNVPGIITTKNEAQNIKRSNSAVYIYSAGNYISGDYKDIYEGLNKKVSGSLIYNSSLYDYEPWSGGSIYEYMYVVLVILGVAGIAYQLSVYNKTRKYAYGIIKNMGATKLQMIAFICVENAVIVISSSVIGLILSIIAARLICFIVELRTGISFFTIDRGIYISLLIMLIMAVVVGSIVNICGQSSNRLHRYTSRYKLKRLYKKDRHTRHTYILNKNNYVKETYKRLMLGQGIVQSICIRLFSLAMMIIMIICIVNSVRTYADYKISSQKSDIIAFYRQDNNAEYIICNAENDVQLEYEAGKTLDLFKYIKDCYSNAINNVSWEMYSDAYKSRTSDDGGISFSKRNLKYNIKNADALMYKDIDESTIEYVRGITGVDDISYGYFETARVWTWNTMDYNKMGIPYYVDIDDNKNIHSKNSNSKNSDSNNASYSSEQINPKYLFATEYVEADSRVYDVLADITGKDEIDIQAFKDGRQVVIFLDKNPEGVYDDTITKGTDIGLMCYKAYPENYGIDKDYASSYYMAIYSYMRDKGIVTDDFNKINSEYFHSLISDNKQDKLKQMTELFEKNNVKFLDDFYTYWADKGEEQFYQYVDSYLDINIADEKLRVYDYSSDYVPAATAEVAKVIYVDDEVKDKLKEYIPEFGQYTMLASDELGKKALDTQNNILKDYLMLDELPEEINLSMKYNQINVSYGIDSIYNGTANAVASYLGQTGYAYNSYSHDKDLIKSNTIEAYILYGFTGITALLVYVVVSLIILRNRLLQYQGRINILRNTGADKDVIFNIYMKQSIREMLWCIMLMPLMLILGIICIKRYIRNL
ncbi:MAG: ABC transporter permease [Eubacterium sp.]|nr:ABC transporter permease [Eubacterium sp.]